MKTNSKPIVFETFREVGSYEAHSWTQSEPSAMNRRCRVRKYRVTIELVDEPLEAIQERITQLYIDCDNWHNIGCIVAEAKKYGLTEDDLRGAKKESIG